MLSARGVEMVYTVKAVAEIAGVSIRTLHHYDEIGLLRPASASPAGYRLYSRADLERLQQVLFFKELGFGLREIREILDSPGFDRRQALASHRRLLLEQKRRRERLIESVDQSIDSIERGDSMDESAMFEVFDRKQLEEWREEARQKWGSERVDESWQRASRYSREDLERIKAEGEDYTVKIAALMDRDPADAEVQWQVGRHFKLINDSYYACTPEIFRGLGEMYVRDSRFTEFYDRVKPGLADFMRRAMAVYADQLAADSEG
jgi:DNA-binding transcriptional MerR regulator